MKSTRQDVYSAIESERSYQDYRWPEPVHTHSFDEFAYFMEQYLAELKALRSHADGTEASVIMSTQDFFRKITALGVAAQEQNGARRREGW
jgi:hypothetical protein